LWLSAINKRTPQGYFIYFLLGLILVFLPTFRLWPEDWIVAPFTAQNLPFTVLPLALLLLSALCNRIFVAADVFSHNTLWPGQIFILMLLMGFMDNSLILVLAHGLLGVLLVYEMLTLQFNQDARNHCFQIGLYLGIASLFSTPMILMAPFLLLSLRQLKPLNLREYIMFLLAIGLLFYFVWAYAFLTDDYSVWSQLFSIEKWFVLPSDMNWQDWMKWGVIFVAGISLSFSILSRFNSLTVRMRRLASATIYLLLGSVVVAYASGFSTEILFYVAPALALFATMFMLRYSNKSTLEVIHLIFVGIIVAVIFISGF